MKKILLILCLITSYISYAQNNLPPCNGDYTGPCFGAFDYPSGNKYLGQWKDDKKNGQGTLTYASGDRYVGQFKDDKINGQGTYTWGDGTQWKGQKYVGQFKDNKRNGQGTYTYADGEKYVGQFKDEKYDGFGTFYKADGSISQQGLWRDDKFIQAQTPPSVTPPVVPKPPVIAPVTPNPPVIAPVTPKPPVNNAQDIKRQKCIRLGLAPGSADFQQCIN